MTTSAAPAPPAIALRYATTLRLAVPSIVENLFQSTVYLVDTLMLATVGKPALAASALLGIFLWRLAEAVGCLQRGVSAYVARRWGADETEVAGRVAAHGAFLAFCIGTVVAIVVGAALPWIVRALGADEELAAIGVPYALPIVAVLPFIVMRINLSASLRAAGDTVTPQLATLLVNVTNVFLNWVLIFGNLGAPKMGMTGGGIATAAALLVGSLFLLWRATRGVRPRRLFHDAPAEDASDTNMRVEPTESPMPRVEPDTADHGVFRLRAEGVRLHLPGATGPILRIAGISFLEELCITIGFLAFAGMIAHCGQTALAAHSAISAIEAFSYNGGYGFAVACATLVGQALGRRDIATAHRAIAHCLIFSTVAMGGAGIVFTLFPEQLLGMFSKERDVLLAAVPLLIIAAMEQPMLGATQTLAGTLRGAGDALSPTIAQLFGTIGVRVGLGWYLGFERGMGIEGIYWATVADWTLRAAILGGFVLRGRWRTKKL